MKRIMICLILILSVFSICVCAQSPTICDYADILTTSQEHGLQQTISQLVEEYGFQPVIVTVNSLDGKSPKRFAEDFYLQGGFGTGESKDGILLLIALDSRDLYIAAHGQTKDVVTNSDIDDIEDGIISYLSNGDYFEAFESFLSLVAHEYDTQKTLWIRDLLIALVIGTVVAGITLFFMRRTMNTARQQSGAANYMKDGTFDLYECRDIYLYSRTTKVRKSQNNNSGSRSSGSSFGGRGRKF